MELEALLSLTVTVAVGRLCLSLVPPGWPGDHNRLEGGATLCASWLLGAAALALLPWLWLWAGVLVVRSAALPGAMRPRHERNRNARPLWLFAFAALASTHWLGNTAMLVAAGLCGALFAVLGWSTWRARADRRARSMVWLGSLAPLVLFFAGR